MHHQIHRSCCCDVARGQSDLWGPFLLFREIIYKKIKKDSKTAATCLPDLPASIILSFPDWCELHHGGIDGGFLPANNPSIIPSIGYPFHRLDPF